MATPLGSEFRVNTYTTSSQRLPAIATGPGGDFVVAWMSIVVSDKNETLCGLSWLSPSALRARANLSKLIKMTIVAV